MVRDMTDDVVMVAIKKCVSDIVKESRKEYKKERGIRYGITEINRKKK